MNNKLVKEKEIKIPLIFGKDEDEVEELDILERALDSHAKKYETNENNTEIITTEIRSTLKNDELD